MQKPACMGKPSRPRLQTGSEMVVAAPFGITRQCGENHKRSAECGKLVGNSIRENFIDYPISVEARSQCETGLGSQIKQPRVETRAVCRTQAALKDKMPRVLIMSRRTHYPHSPLVKTMNTKDSKQPAYTGEGRKEKDESKSTD